MGITRLYKRQRQTTTHAPKRQPLPHTHSTFLSIVSKQSIASAMRKEDSHAPFRPNIAPAPQHHRALTPHERLLGRPELERTLLVVGLLLAVAVAAATAALGLAGAAKTGVLPDHTA